jgi:hypothetical protein
MSSLTESPKTMADLNDVRRIALALPETVESGDRFAFSVRNRDKLKGFVSRAPARRERGRARDADRRRVAVSGAEVACEDAREPVAGSAIGLTIRLATNVSCRRPRAVARV